MATCGEYELEAAIGWGRRATFFTARITGAKGPAIVVIRRARIVERAMRHAFLRAAAEQQAAVGAGCRRLAPILGFDCDDSGFAYYATARYETSVAEFLDAGCQVDGALLREIVTGVLAVLSELHEKSRRAHGNLTPGNILLDAQGRVFLTDLAPSAKDATTADDLFALGTLIYQLVRRTARIGMLNPPLDYSPEWTESLGDDAEGWREFTNRLLTKSRNSGPDALKAAAGNVKSLASLANIAAKAAVAPMPVAGESPKPAVRRAPPKKRSPLPKIIAFILLLAGGAGGYVWWKNKEAEKKAAAAVAAAEAAKREHDKALPETIRGLRADLKKSLPTEFAGDGTLTSLLARIGKSLDGSGTKSDVTALLGNWEVPDKMKAQAAAWRSAPREWTALAGQLEAAAQIDADGDTSIIEQLRTAIVRRNAANDLDRAWNEVTFTLKDLAAENNRLLPNFEAWTVNEIVVAKNLPEAAKRAEEALGKLREVLAFQRANGARVLWVRFEKDSPEVVKTPASGLMQGWPDRWRQAANRFIGPADEKRAEWARKLDAAGATIPRLAPAEQPKWRKIFQDASTASADALESDVATVDALVAKLAGMRLPIEDAKEQYNAILKALLSAAENAKDKRDAQDAVAKFESASKLAFVKSDSETKRLLAEYQKGTGTADIVTRMKEALNTPDKINLDFSQPGWENVTPQNYDPAAAWYKFSKDGASATVPFLALGKTGYAMAAIETPLILARLSGSAASPPSQGPKIRKDGFFPETDWLWKAPTDLINRPLGIRYFAPGILPGDTGQDYSPTTWLSFQEAMTMAAKLGGQLPTTELWTAALGQAGGVQRLRSRAWSEQIKLLPVWLKQTQEPQNSSAPDWGSFSKKTGLNGTNRDYITDLNPTPGAVDDGKLWLRWVMPDGQWTPKNGFVHLIGNAAEWVNNNGSPAVIGGSVVSPPSLPTKTPIPLRDGAYFDVTFRLVVKLGEGGEGAGLKKFKEIAAGIVVPAASAAQ